MSARLLEPFKDLQSAAVRQRAQHPFPFHIDN
jgi:hypothetical protein